MFKELRSNSLLALIIVVFMACMFWVNTFFAELHPYDNLSVGVLSSFYSAINGHGALRYILGVLLTIIPALLLNRSFNRNDFIDKNVYLVGFFYVLGVSLVPSQFYISPVLLGNFFLVLSFVNVLRFRRNKDHKKDLFNSVLLLAVGSFFYPTLVLLILYPFISLLLIKTVGLREFFLTLLALFVPYFSFALIALGLGHFELVYAHFESYSNFLFVDAEPTIDASLNWMYYILLFIHFTIIFLSMLSSYGSQGLQTRRLLLGVITLAVMELMILVLEYFDLLSATFVLDFVVISAVLDAIYYFPQKRPFRTWMMYLGFIVLGLIYVLHYSDSFVYWVIQNISVF